MASSSTPESESPHAFELFDICHGGEVGRFDHLQEMQARTRQESSHAQSPQVSDEADPSPTGE